jgi:lipopolysaccharide export system permease protein
MSRLDRYLLSQLLAMFGFFALIMVAVALVNRAVRLFDRLISDGQSLLVFLEFTALSMPQVIRVAVPLAAFAAAVAVTVRLMRDSEFVVAQSAGASPWRLARPVIAFGLIAAAFLSVLMHVIVPISSTQLMQRQAEIAENITARLLTEGRFLHPAEGVTLYVREITPEGLLRDLYLSDNRRAEQRTDYTAREAFLTRGTEGPVLVMINGMAQSYGAGGRQLAVLRFGDLAYDLGRLIGPSAFATTTQMLATVTLLRESPEDIAAAQATLAEFRAEAFTRFSEPFLSLMAALVGFGAIQLGAFNRLGRWKQVLGALVLLAVIQGVNNAGTTSALRDEGMALAVFAPVVLGGVVAAVLLWLASYSGGRLWGRPKVAEGAG